MQKFQRGYQLEGFIEMDRLSLYAVIQLFRREIMLLSLSAADELLKLKNYYRSGLIHFRFDNCFIKVKKAVGNL